MGTERKTFEYGVGALAIFVISLGIMLIAYAASITPFIFWESLINIPAWIFGPLGVYTLVYSVIARKESTYYVVWGTIMVAIAIISSFYNAQARTYLVNPFIILGILVIIIAIIGIVAYWRSRK